MGEVDRRTLLKAAAIAPVAAAAPAALGSTSLGGLAGAAGGLPTVTPVPIIPRAAWGARRPRRMRRHVPVRLTLHHTSVRSTRRDSVAAELRGIQAYHLSKGADDIDYHFLVDRRGHVFEGRDFRYRGDTQTEYDPTGHFLVCCLGDYEGVSGAAQHPTRATLRSVVLLFAWAAQHWDIPARRLGGHRDYAATSCPGDELYELIRDRTLQRRITRAAAVPIELRPMPVAKARRLLARLDA